MEIIKVQTEEQLAGCLDVRRQVFIEEQGVPVELENDAYDDRGCDECTHILIQDSGVPVGTGRWIWYKAGTAKLQRIAILAAYRGRGLGKVLIRELEQTAGKAGAKVILLDSQCHAEEFYAKLGYTTISEVPFEDAGIPHVRMEKRL